MIKKHARRFDLGSARVSCAGECVLALANFSYDFSGFFVREIQEKDRFGETPKPARETRALPGKIVRSHSLLP